MKLPSLQIASPCHETWDDMSGDERARHCARCDLDVYDLSGLTAAEAEDLLERNGDNLCVRFFQRADGTVITKDCPVGVGKRRRVAAVAAGALAAGAAAAAAGAIAMTPGPGAIQAAAAAPPPASTVVLPAPPPPVIVSIPDLPDPPIHHVRMGKVSFHR